jgi:hypothetical protein
MPSQRLPFDDDRPTSVRFQLRGTGIDAVASQAAEEHVAGGSTLRVLAWRPAVLSPSLSPSLSPFNNAGIRSPKSDILRTVASGEDARP